MNRFSSTPLLISVFLAGIFLLSTGACSSAPESTQMAVGEPSKMPEAEVPPTEIPVSEEPALPTSTNTQTPAPTASSTNSPTASYTPTEILDLYDQLVISPDGKYVAKMYGEYFYPTGVETIEVLDVNGAVLWKIPYQGEIPEGDPRPYLRIYQWSKNSSHLYFYYAFGYDGIPTLWNGFDLQSLDVASGEIKRLLPGEGLMAFAISPDEDSIAFTRMQDEPRRLIIRNLANGREQSSMIEIQSEGFTQAGDISWSPQGDKIFIYTHRVDEEIMQGILVDVKSMEMQTLFEFWEGNYSFNGWTENGIEFLIYPGDEVIRFDVNTGEATPIGTATPAP